MSCMIVGDLEGAPVLTSVSSNQCVYEFEWHTAGACVLSQATGSDCKVFDKELGTQIPRLLTDPFSLI